MTESALNSLSLKQHYGPWAVIAGASEGTGRAFATELAAAGINLILLARRRAPLDALAEQLRGDGAVEVVTASVDLAREDACEQVREVVADRDVGLYVGNAGADPNGARFLDGEFRQWRDLAQRNVMTTMACCHHFGRAMKARGGGGILLVGSGSCYGGGSHMAVYSASKAFELCFAESLWSELRPHNVDVLYLILGQTDTPALRQLLSEKGLPAPDNLASPAAVARTGLARLPRGPLHNWGQGDDVAGMAPNSPDQRRARILAIDEATKRIFGDD